MSEQKITPHNVTKPIQLLAAWLVGLILINSSFLGAANLIQKPDWAAGLLVIAAVINVPLFLVLIFFLQTKFRAELQEDTYYSRHLEMITGEEKHTAVNDVFLEHLKVYENKNENKLTELFKALETLTTTITVDENIDKSQLEQLNQAKNVISQAEKLNMRKGTKVAVNDLIPNYKNIAKDIVKSGYQISQIFGSTSKSPKPPKDLVVSISENLSKKALLELYPLFKKYGFERISYVRFSAILPNRAEIYFGSYVDELGSENKSVLISEEIDSVISNDDISMDELASLLEEE